MTAIWTMAGYESVSLEKKVYEITSENSFILMNVVNFRLTAVLSAMLQLMLTSIINDLG